MLFAQEAGLVPLQVFDRENGAVLAGLTEIKVSGEKTGYLFITISPESFAPGFGIEGLDLEYMALDQVNDRMAPRLVKEAGDISLRSFSAAHVRVPGTLFRVVVPQDGDTSIFSRQQKWLILVLGVLLLAFGLLLRREMMNPKQELAGDPEQIGPPDEDLSSSSAQATTEQSHPENPDDKSQPDPGSDTRIETESKNQPDPSPAPEEDLRDLVFDKPLRRRRKSIERPPVELTKFRAYDIRGVVGESLDDGITYKVGQAVGSVVMEQEAGPVVVARDGRHSGPDLLDGLVAGLISTGCDVRTTMV
jgi:hypothetical protein